MISFQFCISISIFLRPVKVSISVAPFPLPEYRATGPIRGVFLPAGTELSQLQNSHCHSHSGVLVSVWFLRHFDSHPCLQREFLYTRNQTVEKEHDLYDTAITAEPLLKWKGLGYFFHPGHVTVDVHCFSSLKGNFEGKGGVE